MHPNAVKAPTSIGSSILILPLCAAMNRKKRIREKGFENIPGKVFGIASTAVTKFLSHSRWQMNRKGKKSMNDESEIV